MVALSGRKTGFHPAGIYHRAGLRPDPSARASALLKSVLSAPPVALFELLAGTAGARIIASDLAPIGRIFWVHRAPARVGLVPARARRIGKGPAQERTNGFGKLLVVLERHIKGDSIDMVHVVEEPRTGIDHVHDRPRLLAEVGETRVHRTVVQQHTIAAPPAACRHGRALG